MLVVLVRQCAPEIGRETLLCFKTLHIPEVSRGPVVWSMPGHCSKVKNRLFLVIFNPVDGNTTNAWTPSFYSRGNMFAFTRPFPVTDWSPEQNGPLEELHHSQETPRLQRLPRWDKRQSGVPAGKAPTERHDTHPRFLIKPCCLLQRGVSY